MELIKRNIQMSCVSREARSQITLDDDFNVTDSKPDIDRIINDKGSIYIEEVRPQKDKILISGKLDFSILYFCTEDKTIQSMSGEIPFQELINVDNIQPEDDIRVKWEIEDLAIRIVNSRKISVRAIVIFLIKTCTNDVREIAVDIEPENEACVMKSGITMIGVAANKKDTMRIREEIILEKNKPNISEILWKNVNIRNVETRAMDDVVKVKGELTVFILYHGEEDGLLLQWQESILPFTTEVECAGIDEDMIANLSLKTLSVVIDAKPDADGENRMIMIDMVSELDLKVYSEESVEVIEDVYSIEKEINLLSEDVEYEELLINNNTRSKFQGNLKFAGEDAGILQIIFTKGEVKIDDLTAKENTLNVEGAISAQVMYISSDDFRPIGTVKGDIPFTLNIEVPDIDNDCIIDINAGVDQIFASVGSKNELEIKGNINALVFVRKKRKKQVARDMEIYEQDTENLRKMPGIVGYVVKKDDTLWKVAKAYHTTVDNIMKINGLQSEKINEGEKIILCKTIINKL